MFMATKERKSLSLIVRTSRSCMSHMAMYVIQMHMSCVVDIFATNMRHTFGKC